MGYLSRMKDDPGNSPSLIVLVVAGAAESCSRLRAGIERAGHRVHVSPNRQAALQELIEVHPQLIFIEPNATEVGDDALIRDFRRATKEWVPVIVVASSPGESLIRDAMKAGADDYLDWPWDDDLVAAKLRLFSRVSVLQAKSVETTLSQGISKNNNVPEAVITFNHLECVEDANIAARRMLCGDPSSDLIGRTTIEVFGTNLAQLLSKRKLTLTSASGARFPAQVSLSEWVEDTRPRYTLVIRDLTEQTQIDRMKDEFLATVSHELRTPLASVLGALGLLSAGATGALPESARTLTDVAYRNGQRLSRLVDDILDLTKLESDRLVLMQSPTKIVDLVHEAIAANETLALSSKVGLRLEETEQRASEAEVMLDPDRFIQVMTNLLSNAIKHSPSGGIVWVAIRSNDQRITISVKDDGPGIEPHFRGRVFEKFSQADASDRRAQGGMGLGLYITRMLVQRMGGKISVDSSPGQGAEFVVDFALNSEYQALAKKRILHIDFDLDARLRVARWFDGKANLISVANYAQAKAQGLDASALIVIANPRAQGMMSDFYTDLRRLAKNQDIFIYSDSVEEASATSLDFQWLSVSDTSQNDFIDAVLLRARTSMRKALA